MAAPTVTALSPASGPAGTLVTLTGTGFTEDASAVMFGAVSAGTRFSVISGTQMTAYAPAGTGTVEVNVTTPGGVGTTGSDFTYDAYVGPPAGGGGSAPTVTSLTPATAVDNDGGDDVVIAGTGFTTTTAVFFGTSLAQFSVTSDTALAVVTPAGSGVVDVTVVTPYGISANTAADNFTYPVGLIPTITSFTPASAGEMALLTITGTNFWTAASLVVVSGVTFTGAGATEIPTVFRAESATSLKVYVPEGAVTGVIKVYSEAGSATSASFTCLGTVYDVVQTSANGKNKITYSTSDASGTGIAGDVWFKYGTGATAGQVIAQWTHSGAAWVATTLNNSVIATLDCAKLTAGTIAVAIELTAATITGGTIRTAASGNRVELAAASYDRANFYSGSSGEDACGSIMALTAGAETASLWVYGPRFSPTAAPYVQLYCSNTQASITLSAAGAITLDSALINIAHNLTVTGSVKPSANWSSIGSDDGIWIQDRYASALDKRWKIVFNSSSKGLSVSDGTNTYSTTLA